MTDETREARIAAAEARQEAAYAEGGTVEEMLADLDAMKTDILAEEEPTETVEE